MLVVLVAVFLGVALVRNWQAVRSDLQDLSWVDLLASGIAGALAVTCSGMGWRVVLSGLGERVPVHPALTIFFAGQLGKYVPGSVWTAAIQADLGRRRTIARSTMLVSYVVALMIAVATGGLVGLLVLFGAGAPRAMALWMLLLAAVVGVALLRPGWMNRGLAWAFARAGRTPPPVELPGRALAASVAWLIACWGFFGLHAWLLARPLGAGAADLAPTVGAFALAFVAGPARRAAAGRGGCARGGPGCHARRVDRRAGRAHRQPRVAAGPAGCGPRDGRPVRRRWRCPRGPVAHRAPPQRTRAQPFGPLSSMQSPCCGALSVPARLS